MIFSGEISVIKTVFNVESVLHWHLCLNTAYVYSEDFP